MHSTCPAQAQLYVTPKLTMSIRRVSRSRHLALILPLGHFNGENAYSPQNQTQKTHGDIQSSISTTTTCLSLKHNPSHVRRHTLPSQPSQLLITPFRLHTHNFSLRDLQHQKQTQYSTLQIKTYP